MEQNSIGAQDAQGFCTETYGDTWRKGEKKYFRKSKKKLGHYPSMVIITNMKKMKLTFSDQIRKAIEDDEMSRYAISKATGVSQGDLSNFVHGKKMISLRGLDKIADLLGLHVLKVEDSKPKGGKKHG